MRPRAWPEGPRKAGIGQRRGCQTAPMYTWVAHSPLRGRIFLRKRLLRPTRSRSILPQPLWDGALPAACLVKLIAKGESTIRVVAFRVVRPAKPTARAKTYSGLP